MSKNTQEDFERLVEKYYSRQKDALNLMVPKFERSGFLTKAVMVGTDGFVEILYGPAEYHAEVFVSLLNDKKRWTLAELMSFNTVRDWLINYSKNVKTAEKTELEADIEWIFLILIDGLRGLSAFEWITSKPRNLLGYNYEP